MGQNFAGKELVVKHLALYNPTTKVAQYLEDYDPSSTNPEGKSNYLHNLDRYIAESKNRGTWNYYDSDALFSATMPTYSGGSQPNSLLLIGDSRTYMWKTTATKFFTEYTTVDNRGVPGDTAQNQCSAVATWGLGMYKKAVISIGVNDSAYDYTLTILALNTLISVIRQHAETVYVTTIPSINTHLVTVTNVPLENYIRSLSHLQSTNASIPTLCANRGVQCIDLYGYMTDAASGTLKTAYDDGGGIHFNDAGYTAIRTMYSTFGI